MRRNIFRWKHEEIGNLEAKVKSFCAVPHLLRVLKDFILFAEKDLPTIEKVSEEFYEALKKAKVDVREHMVPQRTHISIILLAHKDDDPTTVSIFDYIERRTEWKRPVPTSATDERK